MQHYSESSMKNPAAAKIRNTTAPTRVTAKDKHVQALNAISVESRCETVPVRTEIFCATSLPPITASAVHMECPMIPPSITPNGSCGECTHMFIDTATTYRQSN